MSLAATIIAFILLAFPALARPVPFHLTNVAPSSGIYLSADTRSESSWIHLGVHNIGLGPSSMIVAFAVKAIGPVLPLLIILCILYSSHNIPMKVLDWMWHFGSGSFVFLAFPIYGSTKLRQLRGSEFEIIVLKRTSGRWKLGFGNSFIRSRSPFNVSKCFNKSSLSVAFAVWRRLSMLLTV